jgi:hypothetical protein
VSRSTWCVVIVEEPQNRALADLADARDRKVAAQRSPRCEERLKKCRHDPWWLLAEAEQHHPWNCDTMPKRELTEVSVERQEHRVSALGFCRDIHISDAWSELRDVQDIEAEAAKRADAAARETLVGQVPLIHRSL